MTGGDGLASQKSFNLKVNDAVPVIGDFVWNGKNSMPVSGEVGASAVSNDRIYFMGIVLGGGTYLTNYEYDPAADSWTRKADVLNGVEDGGAATLNGKIYVVGGPLDSRIRIYDPTTDTWSVGAALPTIRRGIGLAAAGGRIYAIGGRDDAWRGNVEAYDPASDTWTPRQSMPTPRGYAAIAVVNEKIYVIGGENDSPLCVMEIYDPSSDSWSTGPFMPTSRAGATAAVLNDRIYVIGGWQGNAPLNVVEEYQPNIADWTAWTQKKSSTVPRAFGGGGVVNYRIYIAGGLGDTQYLASLEEGTLANVPLTPILFI